MHFHTLMQKYEKLWNHRPTDWTLLQASLQAFMRLLPLYMAIICFDAAGEFKLENQAARFFRRVVA